MVIASAIISITINPFLFKLARKYKPIVNISAALQGKI